MVSTVSLASVAELLASTAAANRSFPSLDASQTMALAPARYTVNVSNTGPMDSDDVVLGFLTPPGAGANGVPRQTLFGFERVHVKAGETVTVHLYPELTQFTQVRLDGSRVAVDGEYSVRFGLKETAELGMGFAEHRFTAIM
jgi:hypothetical protein